METVLLTAGKLRAGEASGIALLLLRSDEGEDPVEMLVLDDDAGIELGMILRVEASCQHAAVDAHGDRAVLGFADDHRRPAQSPGGDRVVEHVEIAFVVHRELATDATRLLQGEELGRVT